MVRTQVHEKDAVLAQEPATSDGRDRPSKPKRVCEGKQRKIQKQNVFRYRQGYGSTMGEIHHNPDEITAAPMLTISSIDCGRCGDIIAHQAHERNIAPPLSHRYTVNPLKGGMRRDLQGINCFARFERGDRLGHFLSALAHCYIHG